jgi:hypothetical protein
VTVPKVKAKKRLLAKVVAAKSSTHVYFDE